MRFFTFEGIDGAGKTTAIDNVAYELRQEGFKVTTSREPGGPPLGEVLRRIMKHEMLPALEIGKVSQAMLLLASRVANLESLIMPALERGDIVLVDRFHASTIAYQYYGNELDREIVNYMGKVAQRVGAEHAVIFLDIPPKEAIVRTAEADKLAGIPNEAILPYLEKVYRGYKDIAEGCSLGIQKYWRYVNTSHHSKDYVTEKAVMAIKELLRKN